MERMQNLDQFKDKKDLVNGYLQAKKEHPNVVGDSEIIGYMILNVSIATNQLCSSVFANLTRFWAAQTHLPLS
jgi:hypothetical protein